MVLFRLYCHPWYIDYEHYPNGAADMAGYWQRRAFLAELSSLTAVQTGIRTTSTCSPTAEM